MTAPATDLSGAVAAGIVTAEQAERLAAFLAAQSVETQAVSADIGQVDAADNERFRVLGGFSDVFVAIGLFLLYGALLAAAGIFNPFVLAPASALVAWGLSEVFSRRMRLALPSILLANAFALSMLVLVFLVVVFLLDGTTSFHKMSFTKWLGLPGFVAGAGVLLAAWLHFRRFGVPINWAIGASGVILMALSLITQIFGIQMLAWLNDLMAVFGFAVFGVALWLDGKDPRRVTTRSDCAFWLHLLAAPMIVHPLIGGYVWGSIGVVSGLGRVSAPGMATLLLIIGLFALIALVSIVIDRRALLVSGLSYTGVAIAMLVNRLGVGGGQSGLIITLLILAVIVLSMSAFWSVLRRAIVPRLPLGRFTAHLPPA